MAKTKVIKAKQGTIQWRDVIKSAVATAIIPALVLIQNSIDKGEFIFNWKNIAMTAVASFVFTIVRAWLQADRVIVIPDNNTHIDQAEKIIKKAV